MEKIIKNDINYVIGDAIAKEMKNDLLSIRRDIINFPKTIKSSKKNPEIYDIVGDAIVKEIKSDMPCLRKILARDRRTR